MFTSTGVIKYDPPRPGMKKRTHWWAIVKIDKEITRYYRWWVKNRFHVDLYQPSWDAHISIIRGEKPADDKRYLWKKYDGRKVEFKYSHVVQQAKKPEFWLVEVECDLLKQIRKEFEFPTNWKFHITIGRTW